MSTIAVPESAIIERLILSPEKAAAIASLAFAPEDERRMRELMDLNNQRPLTDEERGEMESFQRVGNLLGILQARARLALRNTQASQ
jgi:hypothetical protein